MQNSVAPVAAVSTAALTSDGMSSQAARTGEGNRPDCEQKWQSSGQPPVLTRDDALDLDLGAAPAHAAPRGRAASSSGRRVVGQPQARRAPAPRRQAHALRRAPAARAIVEDVGRRSRVLGGSSGSVVGVHAGSLPHRRRRRAPGPARPRAASRNSGASSAPAPSRQRAGERPGGQRLEVARRCCRQARSGSAGQAPMTTPASASPRCASASRVSAVWLRVPSAGSATTSTRRARSRARSAMVAPSSSYRTSSPPAPSTSTRSRSSASVARSAAALSRRSSGGSPRAPGGRGGGERVGEAGVARAGRSTPASRRTSSRSPGSPGRRRSAPASRPRPATPRAARQRGHGGGDDRLADAGPGAGDDQDAHAATLGATGAGPRYGLGELTMDRRRPRRIVSRKAVCARLGGAIGAGHAPPLAGRAGTGRRSALDVLAAIGSPPVRGGEDRRQVRRAGPGRSFGSSDRSCSAGGTKP